MQTVVSDVFGVVRVEQRGHYGERLGMKHRAPSGSAADRTAVDPAKGKRGAGGYVWVMPRAPSVNDFGDADTDSEMAETRTSYASSPTASRRGRRPPPRPFFT